MLLQPCLPALPDLPASPMFVSDGSDSLSSDSDLDITSSWRASHTDAEYAGPMSEQEEADESAEVEPVWPTALDLRVPDGARVVTVTGPNTGMYVHSMKPFHVEFGVVAYAAHAEHVGLGVLLDAIIISCR